MRMRIFHPLMWGAGSHHASRPHHCPPFFIAPTAGRRLGPSSRHG
jgi:hypothetical protein